MTVTATITGFITDPSGGSVPGAEVTVVRTETGLTRTTHSSADGSYTFPGLPIGNYELSTTQSGFQAYKQSGILLHVNQTVRVDVPLRVGAVNQTVQVIGQAPMMQTDTSSQGQVVDQRRLSDLPLNGRNPIQLATLVAGAAVVYAPAILNGYRGGSSANINGGRSNANDFVFDSNSYHSVYTNTGLNYPNPDALQEFNLLTHNYSAEFGRNSGAVFNAVTKSGSNGFHGDVWEFLRNDALNARNFFSPTVPVLRQNQFGFVAGGPIKKNKLFWFGSYQGFRIRNQTLLANQPVATSAERQGDFSADPPIIDPTTGKQFPGNIIPQDRLSPISTKWYDQYVPLPDSPTGRTITRLSSSPRSVNQGLAKVDWDVTDRQTLSGRWFYDKSKVENAFMYPLPNYATGLGIVKEQDGNLTYTYAIRPTLLNQAQIGLSHVPFDNGMTPDSLTFKVSTTSLGINMPAMRPYSPVFHISGNVDGWINAEFESGMTQQYGDTLTWVHGKHSFKFGMAVLVDDYHNRSFAFNQGSYNFDGSFTGNGMADFLLGKTSYVQYNAGYFADPQSIEYYPFVQNDWKVTPHLTLNLGFRYELNHPWVDNTSDSPFPNQQATFKPGQQSRLFPAAPPSLVYPGDPGVPDGLYPIPKANLQPRLGFAWSPGAGEKWVIRGAFGLFSDAPWADTVGQMHANEPFVQITRLYAPAGGLADPFQGYPGGNPWPFVFDPKNPHYTFPVPIQGFLPENQTDPRIAHWNLSVQRSFGPDWLFDVSYVANSGRHQIQVIQANPARYIPGVDANGQPLSTPANVESRRILQPGEVGYTMLGASRANSSYQSLQFTVRKRMSRGLTILSSYTYSHTIDQSSTTTYGGAVQTSWPFNYDLDRGNSDFDRRHVYALSLIYDLPRLGTSSRIVNYGLGGWEVANIFTAGTGTPFTVVTGTNNSLTGDGNDRPDVIGDPLAVGRGSRASQIAHWFNGAAFLPNPIGSPGTAARNLLFNPGNWGLDFSLLKEFPISEKWGRFQFRSEFFNIFNNVNLGCPVANLQDSRLGQLTCAGDPRLIQFGLKYIW